jgi:hypothetical protein
MRDIEGRLAKAEAAVLLITKHVRRQQQLLLELERDGHDNAAGRARGVLQTIQQGLQLVIQGRDQLKAKLGQQESRKGKTGDEVQFLRAAAG